MCLILLAYNSHPRYQLVIAANRDEFYKRPTRPAAFWPEAPDILAGKDLQEGGTWMGVTTTGRFAALTNYRDPSRYQPQAPSRGRLVRDYLQSKSSMGPEAYIESLPAGGEAYNGFNLLLGDSASLFYYSNREKLMRPVPAGVHGLSNALLDVPWPKVRRGIKVLTEVLQDDDIKAEQLFTLMADRELPDDQELPQTGVGLERERMLAPTFVTSPDYGTKLTTVILADRKRNIQFWERSFSHREDTWDQVYYEISGDGRRWEGE